VIVPILSALLTQQRTTLSTPSKPI
jgi:hypothetical protein